MKVINKAALLGCFLLITLCSNTYAGVNKHDLTAIAKNYLIAKEAVQQKDSTQKDIDHMLSFMRDDIQTEHKPHTTLQCVNDGKGKEVFRKGLSHYLGKYTATKLTIEDVVEGKNMVSVKFSEVIKFMRGGELVTNTPTRLYILEFSDDKISREFRYDL